MKLSRLFSVSCAVLAFAVSAKANLVQNPQFSITPTPYNYPGYANSPAGYNVVANWTINGGGSNTQGQPFWDNGAPPAGVTSVGFLQGALGNTATATQSLNLAAGNYTFSFYENARNCCSYGGSVPGYPQVVPFGPAAYPKLSLSYNGQVISTATSVTPGGFVLVTGYFTTLGGGTGDLTFSSNSPGDGTSLITDVSVVAGTPEPSSLALLGTGVLGVAGFARRKFVKA